MKTYQYEQETFTIYNYDQQKSFSSFLPGIAGLKGIPIWAFYANRGQAITSFGLENKDRAILDFQPANLGYQYTHINGFRTFVKVNGECYEAFSPYNQCDDYQREMQIKRNEVTIIEKNMTRQLQVEVTYYALPEENFGALVREVRIVNLANTPQTLEILDGLAMLLPTGVSHEAYKTMANLMRSWMDVTGVETKIPLFKVRASTSDEAEVSLSDEFAGNFYMSMSQGETVPTIVDPSVIFAQDTTLTIPHRFQQEGIASLVRCPQATVNKVPCGFSVLETTITAHETVMLTTMIGYTNDIRTIRERQQVFQNEAYFAKKRQRGTTIIDELVQPVATKSAYPIFDAYAKQNYLDNLLRGGEPMVFGSGDAAKVYHVFSRKHGDPERDYNFFSLAPEYYSQGNGNFRDVNQNRRNDVLFKPEVAAYNVKNFYDLMQLDGYNPLGVLGSTFTLKSPEQVAALVKTCFVDGHEYMSELLSRKFTPGKIINLAAQQQISLALPEADVLAKILMASNQHFEASFGEGYWVDHWTYNLDLVENFCAIYPDRQEQFLFEENEYQFYESPATVATRAEKYVLTPKGTVRQYGALIEKDSEKIARLQLDPQGANWVRKEYGQGDVYQTTLIEKLLNLATMKFLNLDPIGVGIQMEANKPGWNDAMNGLPGLFGSGVSESVELLRLLQFIHKKLAVATKTEFGLLQEFADLLTPIAEILAAKPTNDFVYWTQMTDLKERYREQIRFGIAGTQVLVSLEQLTALCAAMIAKLTVGVDKARELGNGLIPTYLYFEATEFVVRKTTTGEDVHTHYGLPAVEITNFTAYVLPHFLEAPARSLKVCDIEQAQAVYTAVRASGMYDRALQMYKTSESLVETTFEIGRAQAFTPGWLEREAIFLHMTYKYLLGLLKAGLYDEFYTEMKTNLVCFRDPQEYGRSPLENVSFIASSVNPDPAVHGQGFVARLTGATSEYLSMWQLMMIGKDWFSVEKDELVFTFNPILAADFFDGSGQVQAMLFGKTQVTYHNQTECATYTKNIGVHHVIVDGIRSEGGKLRGEQALKLRQGQYEKIDVYFEKRGNEHHEKS
ncbi:MAG: cellobiose phosphorylase [Culicoidibacterales bacterium]